MQDYLMNSGQPAFVSLHPFEKLLYSLKDEALTLETIKQYLPDLVALPILEIIRYTRLFP